MNYWLVKQEPDTFSWDDFMREGVAVWDGVRNYQARNNLKAMKNGDQVLFYHSVVGKCVMGIAEVSKEAFPDPTDDSGKWVAVALTPIQPMNKPVTLEQIKNDAQLKDMLIIRHSRLSVMPLTEAEFEHILHLGGLTLK